MNFYLLLGNVLKILLIIIWYVMIYIQLLSLECVFACESQF